MLYKRAEHACLLVSMGGMAFWNPSFADMKGWLSLLILRRTAVFVLLPMSLELINLVAAFSLRQLPMVMISEVLRMWEAVLATSLLL